MKNYTMLAIIVMGISCAFSLDAKVRSISSARSFEKSLSYDSLVVALFYQDQKSNRALRDKNRDLIRMYEDLSTYKRYDDADIIFLKVNVERKELADLAMRYGVKEFPMMLCFNNGKYVLNANGQRAMLKGFVSRSDALVFIDNHCKEEIKRRITEKRNRARELVKEESQAWKPYYYPRDVLVKGYEPEERDENME